MTSVNAKEIRADARGRVTLGSDAVNKQYRVETGEHGEYTLIPIVSIPEREKWLWENPEALGIVRRGVEDLAGGRISRRRSYADHAAVSEE